MKKTNLIIFGLLIFSSCKEQVAKAVLDASKVSTLTKYFYERSAKKLISSTEITYTLLNDVVVDSMISISKYEYDKRGLLETKKTFYTNHKKPNIDRYDYNENDSLSLKMMISEEGDTTFWERYKYYPDGRKIIFHRYLTLHYDSTKDLKETFEHTIYDTDLYHNVFEYKNNICKSLQQYDRYNKQVRLIEYQFEKEKLVKEFHYAIIGSLKMLENVRHFDYSKSEINPDFYSVNLKNDTIGALIHTFDNKILQSKIEINNLGRQIIKTFYQKGKKIGEVMIDKKMNHKDIDTYTYYDNGEIKELKTVMGKINAR